MKRFLDIIVSTIGIVVFLPFGGIIAFILRCTGEGEIFFRQKRIGQNDRPFGLLKFATMLKDSPRLGSKTITRKEDPRVLPVGRFLRKTKLNEVPQLWNVLIGQMSVVGPRPLTEEANDCVPPKIRNEIRKLRPGLTGLGSIVFRDEETFIHESGEDPYEFYRREIAPFKGRLEEYYLQERSFLLDLKLLLVTAWVIVFPRSRIVPKLFPDLPKNSLFNPP
jgi:lipopolysaccharide/colanic/teichoic acid biosynthesis glycosyltransferase